MSVTPEHMNAVIAATEARMDARISRIETAANDIRQEYRALRWWLVGTGVATVLGIAAFNATVLSNMVASFESGKNTAAAIEKASTEQARAAAAIAQTQEDLKAIRERLDKAAAPAPMK